VTRLGWRITAAVAWLVPAVALAASPAVQPTRDVDVTYRVPVPGGGDASILQRLRWSAAGRRQRVDMPTSGTWMVLDFNARRMAVVRDAAREVLDMPAPPGADQPGAGAAFTQVGASSVAGLACTEWRTVDTRGAETQACYTGDGVLLRATAGTRVLMEAIHVAYTPQGADVFQTPADYAHTQSSR
jgi:hypothetical protein